MSDRLSELLIMSAKIKTCRIMGFVIFVLAIAFFLTACSSLDREMMEWEGDYDCIVMSDGRTFCK